MSRLDPVDLGFRHPKGEYTVLMRKVTGDSRQSASTPVLVVGRSAASGLSLLDGCEFSATPCPDAKNAIKMLHRGNHQAVLCDLDSSDARGKALLSTVFANFPDVAVVVVTRPAKLRHGILAMIAGASGYIQTPLQPESVAASLRSALKKKQLDSAARC
jgi:DNA-binding NtrC family response regulator